VLAVEQSINHELAEPVQLPTWGRSQHSGLEGHSASFRRGHVDDQLGADLGGTFDPVHERVPVTIDGEVGQDVPDGLRACGLALMSVDHIWLPEDSSIRLPLPNQ
jgi:hypothetical protein